MSSSLIAMRISFVGPHRASRAGVTCWGAVPRGLPSKAIGKRKARLAFVLLSYGNEGTSWCGGVHRAAATSSYLGRLGRPGRMISERRHHVLTRFIMRHLLAAASVAAATVLFAAPAVAAPEPDPHMPNMQAGYCPGGGMGSQISLAYCDGVPYPDGTYWHAIQYGAPMIGRPYGLLSPGLQCVVGGGPIPQPAPPGGCGGAVPPPPPPP